MKKLVDGVLVELTPAEIAQRILDAQEDSPCPTQITRRQARQILAMLGKLTEVQSAIDSIPDELQRQIIQIEWEDSLTFDRNRPSLIMLATAIGLSSTDLDNMFKQAKLL